MTNYYANLTKEQKKEILATLEFKMRDIQRQIDWYRRLMDGLDADSWQIPTCAQMINYHENELHKVLELVKLLTSED